VLPLPKRDAGLVDRRIHGRRHGRGGREANPESKCPYCTNQHFFLLDFSCHKRRRALRGGTNAHRHDDAGPCLEDRPSDRLTSHRVAASDILPCHSFLSRHNNTITVQRLTRPSCSAKACAITSDRRNVGTHNGCSPKGCRWNGGVCRDLLVVVVTTGEGQP
jgi:hypothetical protein